MKTIKAYQCDYCSFYKVTKKSVQEHEKRCFYNSATASCGTCWFLNNYTCDAGAKLEDGKLTTNCPEYLNSDEDIELMITTLNKKRAEKHNNII